MALLLVGCARLGGSWRGNLIQSGRARATIRRVILSQQRPLEAQLKCRQGANGFGEHLLEVLDGLPERVRLRTGRGLLFAAEQATQIRQPPAQTLEQVVKGLQPERQRQCLDGRLDGPAVQQPAEQLPEPGRGDGMTRQHLGQEDTKGPPAAPALAAIAAKDPLPP